jgi:hypothetical protein
MEQMDQPTLLGLDNLKDATLPDLEVRLKDALVGQPQRAAILRIYLDWLNERLQVIDNSDQDAFAEEIGDWCQSLARRGYTNETVLEEFHVWQADLLDREPSTSRRINLAALEIRHLLKPSKASQATTHHHEHDIYQAGSPSQDVSVSSPEAPFPLPFSAKHIKSGIY